LLLSESLFKSNSGLSFAALVPLSRALTTEVVSKVGKQ